VPIIPTDTDFNRLFQ